MLKSRVSSCLSQLFRHPHLIKFNQDVRITRNSHWISTYRTSLHKRHSCNEITLNSVTQLSLGSSSSRKAFSTISREEGVPTVENMTEEDVGDGFFNEPPPPRQKGGHNVSRKKLMAKLSKKNKIITVDAMNLTENMYKMFPPLIELNLSDHEFDDYLQRMSSFAIDVEAACEMLIKYPSVLSIRRETISAVVGALQSISLAEKARKSILRRCPQILEFPHKRIAKRFTFLKTYLSHEETKDLLTKSVDVFLHAESTLKRKLEFLIKAMSHETKDIVSSTALSYPFKHIKVRHEFLIRAGLFKPIPYLKLIKVLEKEYKDRNKPRYKYFKPLYVVCYCDQDFLKVCTNNSLTMNELAAFEELFEAEMSISEEELLEEEEDNTVQKVKEEFEGALYHLIKDGVSLVKNQNSGNFFNEVEHASCYF